MYGSEANVFDVPASGLNSRRALELLPESKDAMDAPVLLVSMARIYAITGEAEKAIDLLQHSLQTPAGLTVAEIGLDPTWDVLRQHPRFKALIQ